MASYDAQMLGITPFAGGERVLRSGQATGLDAWPVAAALRGGETSGSVLVYLMGWRDPDCVPPQLRLWNATFEDTTGSEYTGPKCGATPITNAFVMLVYEEA